MKGRLDDMKDVYPPSLGNAEESWYVVEDSGMARALSSPQTRDLLIPFIDQESAIKEAAEHLNLSLNQMLYKVRRLVKLGLLIQTRQEARKGRAINYYQAVAKNFFIPYTASPFVSPDEWLVEDFKEREKLLAKASFKIGLTYGLEQGHETFGKRVFLQDDCTLKADFAFTPTTPATFLEEDAPAIASIFVETELSKDDAKNLQCELAALVRKYEKKAEGKRYLLRVGLAPIDGH